MTEKERKLLDTKSAAMRLGLSHQTLEKWRSLGTGPQYVRIGTKAIRYRPSDLDAFVNEDCDHA
ncbi:helix-turn-helix transcriptional regulator [Pseudooceanicola sp. LIPI14-2-Ac024]|uniref:helix-turn-helix transcriptional regulator n=1 Tax=Pseudooceanicola sp. LIPI14-2-Ac024 TaxID=3344875 RepID=UPI0035D0598C